MKQCIAFAALAAMAAGANAAPPEVEPKQPGVASHEKSGRSEAPAQYRSVFEGYRRYEDKDPAPWRELNDEVARAAAKPAAGVSKPPAHEPERGAR